VERLPHGRHYPRSSRGANSRGGTSRRRLAPWSRLAIATGVTGAVVVASVVIPAGVAGAAPTASSPTLNELIAKANKLSNEIDHLGQQYDGLRIQLNQARRTAAIARQTAKRDQKLLAAGQAAIGQIAAQGYMNGNMDPTLQLLQTTNPQEFLNQASIMLQLQAENGDKVSVVAAAEDAAQRARISAVQEQQKAQKLSAAMRSKVQAIQAKENVLNSAAYKQAMAIFQQTGHYPDVPVTGNSIGVRALRFALTKQGDEYVWGGAGPDVFDCSGLVMWAYAQVGISLPHFTGTQWNSGQHISRDEIQPGDLLFFYNLDHVGLYVGDGLFLDAPTFGQPVQIQPIPWASFNGAVRIA
jgi:cell wall-associated NlpC family hydrolase